MTGKMVSQLWSLLLNSKPSWAEINKHFVTSRPIRCAADGYDLLIFVAHICLYLGFTGSNQPGESSQRVQWTQGKAQEEKAEGKPVALCVVHVACKLYFGFNEESCNEWSLKSW